MSAALAVLKAWVARKAAERALRLAKRHAPTLARWRPWRRKDSNEVTR